MKDYRVTYLAKQALMGLKQKINISKWPQDVCQTSFSNQNEELKMPLFSAQRLWLEKYPALPARTTKKMQHFNAWVTFILHTIQHGSYQKLGRQEKQEMNTWKLLWCSIHLPSNTISTFPVGQACSLMQEDLVLSWVMFYFSQRTISRKKRKHRLSASVIFSTVQRRVSPMVPGSLNTKLQYSRHP